MYDTQGVVLSYELAGLSGRFYKQTSPLTRSVS